MSAFYQVDQPQPAEQFERRATPVATVREALDQSPRIIDDWWSMFQSALGGCFDLSAARFRELIELFVLSFPEETAKDDQPPIRASQVNDMMTWEDAMAATFAQRVDLMTLHTDPFQVAADLALPMESVDRVMRMRLAQCRYIERVLGGKIEPLTAMAAGTAPDDPALAMVVRSRDARAS